MIPLDHQIVVIRFVDYRDIYDGGNQPLAMRVNYIDGDLAGFVCLNGQDKDNLVSILRSEGLYHPDSVAVFTGAVPEDAYTWLEWSEVDGNKICGLKKVGTTPVMNKSHEFQGGNPDSSRRISETPHDFDD